MGLVTNMQKGQSYGQGAGEEGTDQAVNGQRAREQPF